MATADDHDALLRLEADLRVEETQRAALDRIVQIEVSGLDRLIQVELAARDRATLEAKELAQRVQGQQNEWRQTVETLAKDKADEKQVDLLRDELKQVREEVAQSRGKGLGAVDVRAWVIAGIGGIAGVIGIVAAFTGKS